MDTKKPDAPVTLKPKKVGPTIIDMHSRGCSECNARRMTMKELYGIRMEPAGRHVDEWMARDMLLDQIYEDCCKCFLSKSKSAEID